MPSLKWLSTLGTIFLVFYFLYIAKPYLIPFVLAIVLCFFIVSITNGYSSIRIKGKKVPSWLALMVSIVTIVSVLWLFGWILNTNIQAVIKEAPKYEAKFTELTCSVTNSLGVEELPNVREAIKKINITQVLSMVTNLVTSVTSNVTMVLIYTIFILLEYRVFGRKLEMIMQNSEMKDIVQEIIQDIKTYIKIKSGASLVTGLLSLTVLLLFGVDFPFLWALLIFLLNFIPTIGSMIAVAFPVFLSLVQFAEPSNALLLLLSLISIQLLIGNILEPRFAGRSLNLSPVVILLSLVLWGNIWGVVGMFLCIPLTVMINLILVKFDSTRSIAIMLSAKGNIVKTEISGETQ